MRRSTSLALLSISIFLGASTTSSQATDKPIVNDVENVDLDKRSIFTVCPSIRKSGHRYCNEEGTRIKVVTTLKKEGQPDTVYYYAVSAGTIEGAGPNVVWDLSKATPGKHSISVGAGTRGVIAGKTVTKTVAITECVDCDPPCSCPFFEISGPSQQVKAGQAFIVGAEVGGDVTYDWTTSAGTIIDGQKGSQVMIRTSAGDAGKVITVTIEIGGADPACNCDRTRSHRVSVVK